MRVLVTGASGFVGRYMQIELARHGHRVLALDHAEHPHPMAERSWTADIRNADRLARILDVEQPDACIHLAAVTFVPAASTEPDLMLSVNVRGTLTLLDAFRSHAPYARILVVSSAHIYGPVHDEIPRREHDEPRPATLYAVSKMAADLAALAFAKREALAIMTARPTNHTGPGQPSRFVVPALARQVRAVAAGDRRDIVTGNLESVRDFADVRDVVRAYRLLLEGGKPRRAYNVSAGNRVPIRRILETLCGQANISPPVRTDPTLFRPVDHSPPLDTTRLRNAVRWSPTISLDATLRDMLCETPE